VELNELDRLVSRTELNPLVKMALRKVRRSIESGSVTQFSISKRSWRVSIEDPMGLSCTWIFTVKDDNGDSNN